jgi:hypothetical protein
MGFTDNVYRIEVYTDTLLGKIEDKILKYLNGTILKHTKNGKLIFPNVDKKVIDKSLFGIEWKYANKKNNKINWRYYLTLGNKKFYLDKFMKEIIYLQKNGDFEGYSYRFEKYAFNYKGVKI